MATEGQINWAQLLLGFALSVAAGFTTGVLVNEYLHRRRAAREEAQKEAAAKPVLREEDDYWVIDHHLEARSFGTAPMMGGIVELGVRDGRVWLRRLWLPKDRYTREAAERVLAGMARCGLCSSGLPVGENIISSLSGEESRGSMPTAREVGLTIGGAFVGKILNDALDYFLLKKIGETNTQIGKILIGAGMILLPFGVSMGRDAEEVLVTGGSFLLTNVVDMIKKIVPSAPATRIVLRPISQTSYTPVYDASALTQ